ncbi:MAG: hypothetical protein LBH46_00805 [Rickettsiales bacterium]|jgi:hypothetical protein|nr:hypothetical protein [Rickettsiales bacterium]
MDIINTFANFREVIYNLNKYIKATDKNEKASFLKRGGLLLTDMLDNGIKDNTEKGQYSKYNNHYHIRFGYSKS